MVVTQKYGSEDSLLGGGGGTPTHGAGGGGGRCFHLCLLGKESREIVVRQRERDRSSKKGTRPERSVE